MKMADQIPSIRGLLALAAVGVSLASGTACPYARGNYAPEVEARHLEARLSPAGPDFGRCPRKSNLAGGGTRSRDWWPCQLSLATLRQNGERSNPLGGSFDYATEFANLDVGQLKKDFAQLQVDSQPWWPADFGNYGPFFVRMSWHSAGTYRQMDGRGGSGMGQQRFAPLNSWTDNTSLDKARRLLWPLKQKYGNKISWADLIAFAGHQSLENMGLPPFGFAFGRVDTWQADEGIFWGSEQEMFPGNGSNTDRYNGSTDIFGRAANLDPSLADTNMALIYVDPRGPNGNPVPKASALDIRTTFGRMGMNDEETVALIAGGHAFGKTHGAVAGSNIGPEPNQAPIENQGLGWKNSFPAGGSGPFAYTSGLEVIWSTTPTKWANSFLNSLFKNTWMLTKSPDNAPQWIALNSTINVPDAFNKNATHKPTMLTSDLALLEDPIFHNISQTYLNNFDYFTQQFNLAWFKLLHRDMGPRARYLGSDVPNQTFIWQDPLPNAGYQTINDNDVAQLKKQILAAPGLNVSNLITTAWGSASSFRLSDKRGGANGARIALQPQRSWVSNNPARLNTVIPALQSIQKTFNSYSSAKQVSLADLIVLGGNAAIEKAAGDAGSSVSVTFTPGRVDATQNSTDVSSFAFHGFRNYGHGTTRALTEEALVDKANLLSLSPPEMTVLIGGLRALNANFDGSNLGIFTDKPGQLTNDYFANLLSMANTWTPVANTNNELFQGKDASGNVKYTGTRADLIFGSHPELRAIAEVYGATDAQTNFVNDFAKAWAKVMELDRYDIKGRKQNNQQ